MDFDLLCELAVATAREAGAMLAGERSARGPDVVQTKSSPTDIVTQMDQAAERLILDRIRAVRPDDGFLGEEGGAHEGSTGVRWVIDPIDGTVNYLYDLPDWAVSIAAQIDGETVAGAIDIPRRGETYTAVRGQGARLHTVTTAGPSRTPETRTPRVSTGVPLNAALVGTGFGYAAERRAHQARVLTGVLPRVRDIRRSGSCCVDLCSLAAGRLDAYYERGVQEWDIAAGTLIVEEAGGRVGGLHGAPPGPDLTIAAAPELFEALHDLLAPLDPARD
ncbi:inositol monophosphatase family protein [Actinomadura sp. HBU206391]|uniref:inositol monophosphatase family protein n=1 Tax=Actinomadura sp. HBU206391 TaxID=2731692 RepID=UPI00164FF7B0|nr:inositol monophosphatase family protein [Actinomadura sp. HBU206391]MBC6458791.1 inositol monophosphatase [Actinomadura sp. HBU206391]